MPLDKEEPPALTLFATWGHGRWLPTGRKGALTEHLTWQHLDLGSAMRRLVVTRYHGSRKVHSPSSVHQQFLAALSTNTSSPHPWSTQVQATIISHRAHPHSLCRLPAPALWSHIQPEGANRAASVTQKWCQVSLLLKTLNWLQAHWAQKPESSVPSRPHRIWPLLCSATPLIICSHHPLGLVLTRETAPRVSVCRPPLPSGGLPQLPSSPSH